MIRFIKAERLKDLEVKEQRLRQILPLIKEESHCCPHQYETYSNDCDSFCNCGSTEEKKKVNENIFIQGADGTWYKYYFNLDCS